MAVGITRISLRERGSAGVNSIGVATSIVTRVANVPRSTRASDGGSVVYARTLS